MSVSLELALLRSGYDLLRRGSLWHATGRCKGWADLNPGEAMKLDIFIQGILAGESPAPPLLATVTGQAYVHWASMALGAVEPPVPVPNPSGVAMPLSTPGWEVVFADDFTAPVPLGTFPEATNGRWGAYPYPWHGTPTWGTYDPHRTTSFHDHCMDIWLHTDRGEHLIAANWPAINGQQIHQLYGRWEIRYRCDSFGYYKPSWLLWPISETWPRDGEIDFPEQSQFSDSDVFAFMHRQGGTSGGDQDVYKSSGYDPTLWHTATIEWLPGRCTFLLDGVKIGESTSRIPNTPMRYVLQNGGSFDTSVAPDTVQGHVFIDWFVVSRPA